MPPRPLLYYLWDARALHRWAPGAAPTMLEELGDYLAAALDSLGDAAGAAVGVPSA